MDNKYRENNKRIAKNTGMLYVRMLFTMVVGLYTSRVILNVLGIEDYGIYNVVGGVIYMFSFITNAMSSSTSRYLTFELGTGNSRQLKKVFSLSLSIHLIISVIILILGETIGLWFLSNKMQIPTDRLDAAIWVFHCTVISATSSIMIVPFHAAIISHEKMSAYAYISIIDVVLKLIVVFFLYIIPFDKLKIYAVLFVGSHLIVQSIYLLYSKTRFKEVSFRFIWDKELFKELFSFAGWNLIGNMAGVLYTQGLNILLNVFFGPAVNAARGVAVQVQGVVNRFSSNFQSAINPQITKSFATNDLPNMHRLIFASSKYSFYLLFFLTLPIMIETKQILTWWLKLVPEHTINFIRIIMFSSILEALANPLVVSVQAHGAIRKYELITGSMLLLILPVSYLALKIGSKPETVFIIQTLILFITHFVRLHIIKPLIKLPIKDYIYFVGKKISIVTGCSIILPIVIYNSLDETFIRFLFICIACSVSILASTYLGGLEKVEKTIIDGKVKQYSLKIIKRHKQYLGKIGKFNT